MTTIGWLQIILYCAIIVALTPLLGAYLTRAWGATSALVPAVLVSMLSLHAFRERRVRPAATDVQPSVVGMRRPTPIQRPLTKNARPESGTRFKAIRAPIEPKPADEESA